MNVVIKKLNGISTGSLKLELPDETELTFGNQDTVGAIISVKKYTFLNELYLVETLASQTHILKANGLLTT